jgi:hypothetical protein
VPITEPPGYGGAANKGHTSLSAIKPEEAGRAFHSRLNRVSRPRNHRLEGTASATPGKVIAKDIGPGFHDAAGTVTICSAGAPGFSRGA